MEDGSSINQGEDWEQSFEKLCEFVDGYTAKQTRKFQDVLNGMEDMKEMMRLLIANNNTGMRGNLFQNCDSHRSNSLRLELPRFDGTDAIGWLFRIQEYFDFHEIPEEQRLWIVALNLEGKASDWYQCMKTNKLLTTWSDFLNAVRKHFGPSQFEDAIGRLSKLTQQGSVTEYQTEFEGLMNKI